MESWKDCGGKHWWGGGRWWEEGDEGEGGLKGGEEIREQERDEKVYDATYGP